MASEFFCLLLLYFVGFLIFLRKRTRPIDSQSFPSEAHTIGAHHSHQVLPWELDAVPTQESIQTLASVWEACARVKPEHELKIFKVNSSMKDFNIC